MPRTAKDERLARVIVLQERINAEQQETLVGTTQDVLIDSEHPRDAGFMNGRTEGYRAITIPGEGVQIGDLVKVQVTEFRGHWLEGRYI